MENQLCKGMQDLLPDDMLRFRHVENAFRTCCLEWGYQEVRTPTLEYLHSFTATGTLTPSMLSKVYSFLDWDGWSGERVVLRPDGTIPVARLYISNLSEQGIARLFYVTNIFAFEETGRENRERWQCGVELLGSAAAMADAEIILLAGEILHNLGLNNFELQLSHAGLIKALIKELKLDPAEEAKVMSKVLDGDWQALMEAKSAHPELDQLLYLLLNLRGESSSFLRNARVLSRQVSQGFRAELEDFIDITTLLDSLGCNYKIDIKAVRSFEYYTGLCFQWLSDGEKIGGGGRYDNLIPLMGGKDIPARGFALYVDPIMKLLPSANKEENEPEILIKADETSPETAKMCFSLTQSLHNAGYTTLLDFTHQVISDYRWTILVSEKRSFPFAIIDRKRGQQQNAASLAEILAALKERKDKFL